MIADVGASRELADPRTRAPIPVLAVANPTAGGDPRALVEVLDGIGTVDVRTVFTTDATEAERIVLDQVGGEAPAVIVAIGGDGTVGRIAAALHRTQLATGTAPPLLIAPGGTGNSSYRGLWGHRSWPEVVAQAFTPGGSRITTIDLAMIEEFDAVVLLGSATGLLPATLLAARTMTGRGRDLLRRATVAAAATLRPYPGMVLVDDEVLVEGEFLVTNVGGMRHRGGDFQLLPHSVLDDGLLDVCVVTAAADMAELSTAAVAGEIDRVPGVRYARGRRIRLQRTDGHPLLIEHDGELLPHVQPGYAIRVVPRGLRVLVPDPSPACLPLDGSTGADTAITKRGEQ